MGSSSSTYQLPYGVLGDTAFGDLKTIDLGQRERERGMDLTHIDFLTNDDLPSDEAGPWRAIDSFDRKVLIVRYYVGSYTYVQSHSSNESNDRSNEGSNEPLHQLDPDALEWSGPQVQAFFQRYTGNEDDWRASGHFGNMFGSSAGINEDDRQALKALLTEGRVVHRGKLVCLTIT